jgi:hypothetical protein
MQTPQQRPLLIAGHDCYRLDGQTTQPYLPTGSAVMNKPTLEDRDTRVASDAAPEGKADLHENASILLRVLEGAGVALYRHSAGTAAELLPTRRDLFQYQGGYAWGYEGAGATNLAHAIAGRIYEFDGLDAAELTLRANRIVEVLLARLNRDSPADLKVSEIKRLVST